jgi:hypothetical protein
VDVRVQVVFNVDVKGLFFFVVVVCDTYSCPKKFKTGR